MSMDLVFEEIKKVVDTPAYIQLVCLYNHSERGRKEALRIACARHAWPHR
jgi:hypothetical protein